MLRGEVTGEVISSDTQQRGNFTAHVVVLKEEKGRFTNHLAVEFFGKTLELGQTIRVGDHVKVSGYASSRESKGRWYTSVNATHATIVGGKVKQSKPAPSESDDPGDQLPDSELF